MEPISTAVGSSDLPFSEAIKHGDTVYVSGQGPIDPESGNVVGETVAEQTTRTLQTSNESWRPPGRRPITSSK
jgi:enamine deaminase RidA (YjgF/YER057c/UK114 family)